MSRIEMLKCDQCGENSATMCYHLTQPAGYNVAYDFCSTTCLMQWAKGQIGEPGEGCETESARRSAPSLI